MKNQIQNLDLVLHKILMAHHTTPKKGFNLFMPVVDKSTTSFLLSKTHKNKNKHLGGIIFLPDDQFDIKNVFFLFL